MNSPKKKISDAESIAMSSCHHNDTYAAPGMGLSIICPYNSGHFLGAKWPLNEPTTGSNKLNITNFRMALLFSILITPYCTRGGSKLVQLKVNTISFGINSFTYKGSKIWNNLPQDVKYVNCSFTCKDLIVRWQGPTPLCVNVVSVSYVICQRYKQYKCEWPL